MTNQNWELAMKAEKLLVLVCALAVCSSFARAKDTRKEVLQSCVQQAKDKELTGDAHAEFMRGCLKMPEGTKPQSFVSDAPQKLAPGQDIHADMQQPPKEKGERKSSKGK
jgi:hypothetical protein